jgi:putative membrane protein
LKSFRQYLQIVLVGLFMGMAELVPGVSAATIALISGYYERLLRALSQLTPRNLLRMGRLTGRAAWREADAGFLLLLLSAMGFSLVTSATLISKALAEFPVAVGAFFFGIVSGSGLVLLQRVWQSNLTSLICLGSGVLCGFGFSLVQPGAMEASVWHFFMSGLLGAFAWILPGTSGGLVLLLLGLHGTVSAGLSLQQPSVLMPIAVGAVFGLLVFSQLLHTMLQKARQGLLLGLVGLMLGYSWKLWPWQVVSAYQLTGEDSSIPLVQEPVMPHTYEILGGVDPMVVTALSVGLFGFASVVLLNRILEIKHD